MDLSWIGYMMIAVGIVIVFGVVYDILFPRNKVPYYRPDPKYARTQVELLYRQNRLLEQDIQNKRTHLYDRN